VLGLKGKVLSYTPPVFTRRVLDSVPEVFQLAEWLLVIVAFQYADVHFGYVAAKIAWVLLGVLFAFYFGVLSSHLLWKLTDNPTRSPRLRFFGTWVLPLLSGAVVFWLQHLLKQMVAAHTG
jgi:hypothetical protein